MNRRRCNGTTLIEVVVGLALLGSLLVALIVAASTLEQRRKRADEKLQAVGILEHVLQDCFAKGFPTTGKQRTIHIESQWNCSFELVKATEINDPFVVVRVQLHRHDHPEKSVSMAEVMVHKDVLGRSEW